jgi:hypothetical protein
MQLKRLFKNWNEGACILPVISTSLTPLLKCIVIVVVAVSMIVIVIKCCHHYHHSHHHY